jgi:pilus assembly protein CpaC
MISYKPITQIEFANKPYAASFSSPNFLGFQTSIAIAIAVLLMSHANLSQAQTNGPIIDKPKTEINISEDSKDTMRNGFAEHLKAKPKRNKLTEIQPYNPIKKTDDQSQIPEIEMFVGETRVFPAPGIARLAVGNGQIMSAAALDNQEIIVFANGVGTSSLFIWNEDGRYQRVKINIVSGDTSRVSREVAAFLSSMPNAKASIVGDKVIVEGDNLSDVDLNKIEKLEKRYPQIVNFTNQLGWEKMIMMDVKVVEFSKADLRELGLKWSAMGGATKGGVWSPIRYGKEGGLVANIAGGTLPIISNNPNNSATPLPSALNIVGGMDLGISAKLNLLAQNGKASVLAEPQLSTRNGSKASFHAGGEIPYSVANLNGVTVQFKTYGIKLEINPKVDRNGVIRATIEAEVSTLDSSVSTASGPALLTRKTMTEFNVQTGETMVLAGLLQRNVSNDVDKVPLLGDIPILGALFRSKRFQDKETELVIFVTPSVVNSQSEGLVERVQRTTERLEKNLDKSPYLSDPLQPGRDSAKVNESLNGTTNYNVNETKQTNALISNEARQLEKLAEGGSTLLVLMDGLILRSEPKTTSPALLQLGRGSVVLLGSENLRESPRGHWRNVVVGELNGWVISEGVAPSHQQPQLKSYTNKTLVKRDQTTNNEQLGSETIGSSLTANSRSFHSKIIALC